MTNEDRVNKNNHDQRGYQPIRKPLIIINNQGNSQATTNTGGDGNQPIKVEEKPKNPPPKKL